MKIKTLFLSLILLTFSVSPAFSEIADDWVTVPITCRFEAEEMGLKLEENIAIEFPETPKEKIIYHPLNFVMPKHYSAEDSEGMVYHFSAIPLSSDRDYECILNIFLEQMENSRDDTKFVFKRKIEHTTEEGCSWNGWMFGRIMQEDTLARFTLIASEKFVYVVETDVKDELYKEIDESSLNHSEQEKIINDSLKTEHFVHSFRLLD